MMSALAPAGFQISLETWMRAPGQPANVELMRPISERSAMLAMVYVVQTSLGLAPALFAGWVVYLAVLWPVTRRLWGQEAQWPNQLET